MGSLQRISVILLVFSVFAVSFYVATAAFDVMDRAAGYYTTQMEQMEGAG